jgi:hypothetical protein
MVKANSVSHSEQEHLAALGIKCLVLQICAARIARSSAGEGDRTIVRHQALTCRTIHTHGTATVVTCPKCRRCSTFVRAILPHIDSCGFESHSFRCEWCASFLAGIIDPNDGELVLSLLEEPSAVIVTPASDPLSGHHDLQCDTRPHGTDEQSSS